MLIETVSLRLFTSLRIGGVASFVEVISREELVEAVFYARREKKRIYFFGGGTNVFFGEQVESILVIKVAIKGISFADEGDTVTITACAGEDFDAIVSLAVTQGFWGIENLSYIPGSVGGAPVQNIGAYGAELKDTLVSVEAFDTKHDATVVISNAACRFGYRTSLFKEEAGRYCIISVSLRLSKQGRAHRLYKPLDELPENASLQEVRDAVIAIRTKKLPDWKTTPNAGSFFKNPVVGRAQGEALRAMHSNVPLLEQENGYKIPAAWLIEHVACMKGVREGVVGTWPTQPLVLVNYGNAKAEDLLAFSDKIIRSIFETTGITLEREVNYVLG